MGKNLKHNNLIFKTYEEYIRKMFPKNPIIDIEEFTKNPKRFGEKMAELDVKMVFEKYHKKERIKINE